MRTITEPVRGAWAFHIEGLDPRKVYAVSPDLKQIQLEIGSIITPWLRASNYRFEF